MGIKYFIKTGVNDAYRARVPLLANILIVAGICLPILLLIGLKRGLVEKFRSDILKSPTACEIRLWVTREDTAINKEREGELEHNLAKISLVIPDITHVVDLKNAEGQSLEVTLNCTKEGDPLLGFYGADILKESGHGIILNRYVADQLGIQYVKKGEKKYIVQGSAGLILTLCRGGGQSQEREEIELNVLGIYESGGSDQAVAYLERQMMDRFEDFKIGRSVTELKIRGSQTPPKPTYDGYVGFCKHSYGAADLRRLHLRGLTVAELDNADDANKLRDLYGLLKTHGLHVYWIHSGSGENGKGRKLGLNSDEVGDITDADDIVIPWSNPQVLSIDDTQYRIIGLTVRGRWLKKYFLNYSARVVSSNGTMRVVLPERSGVEVQKSGEKKSNILEIPDGTDNKLLAIPENEIDYVWKMNVADFLENDIVAPGSGYERVSLRLPDGKDVSLVVESRPFLANREGLRNDGLPIAIVTADLAAYLTLFNEGILQFDSTMGQFVPSLIENLYYGARVYVSHLDDVPDVDKELRTRGYTTLSSKTRVLEMQSYANTLDVLVRVILYCVLGFGLLTVLVVFSEVSNRKRGAIGIMRIMGMPPSGVFCVLFVRALVVGAFGGFATIIFGSLIALILTQTSSATCVIGLYDLGIIFIGALSCCMLGVFIPAWCAARLDPVDAILQSNIQ
ncbi:MAG: hypothetical protein GY928_32685 [Colwellia sp.]|nr:hypothetical protein [Colwellia sp.]